MGKRQTCEGSKPSRPCSTFHEPPPTVGSQTANPPLCMTPCSLGSVWRDLCPLTREICFCQTRFFGDPAPPSSRALLSEPEPALTASAVWIFIDLVLRLADRLQDPEHPNPRFGCTETPIVLGIYCLSPPRTPPPTLANKRSSICPKFWTPQSAVCVVGRRLRSGPIRRRVEAAEGLGGASGLRSGRIRVGGGKATGRGLGVRPIGGRMGHPEAPPRPSCGPAVPPSFEKRGDGLAARGHPPSTALAHATRIRSADASSRKVAANFLARSPPLLPARPAPPAEPGIPRGGAQAEMGNVGACRGPWRRRRAEAQSRGGGFAPLALLDGPLPSALSRWGN